MNINHTTIPVIFLMGPTASGKTELAIELHKKLGCELISVDSALVYRGLDIGTAKPTEEELIAAPHHLIDICEPDNPYSASQFVHDATQIINTTINKGKIPVLVGGTMLYYKALRDGLADLPNADQSVRAKIVEQANEKGWPYMHQMLRSIDPVAAEKIKPADQQRIQRAIEVYQISGKTMTEHYQQQSDKALPYPILNIAIAPLDRAVLRARITQRFENMLANNFIAEVEELYLKKKFSADLPALRSVGYRQACQFLSGEIDEQLMKEKAITATAQLAKRQMTWLRKWPDLHWLETYDNDNFNKINHLLGTMSR